MKRKSAASMKIKDVSATPDPEEILKDWKKGELFKIDSMKNQLKRPDSYTTIREHMNKVCVDVDVKHVDEVVEGLLSRFDHIKDVVEKSTVDSIMDNLESDPFENMFKMVDKDMTWPEIMRENIYFETIRPFAEHYFQLAKELVKARGVDGKDE